MSQRSSRRSFLAGGLAVSAAALPSSKIPVRYRTLGNTGLKVTEVGFGCEAVSDASIFRMALDLGINFFDTARSYEAGNNERVLGDALGARRKEIILCSRSYGKDTKAIMADLETSLKELRTDYLDIWYIGNKDKPAQVTDDMLEVQAAAQKQGKIRYKGISSHRLYDMQDFILKPGRFDVVLTALNFTMGTQFDRALAAFQKAGLGVVAMKVMAGGFKYSEPKYRPLFQRPRVHLAALKWALRNEAVRTTIVGIRDREQLEENIRAMSEGFTAEDAKLLTAHLEHVNPLVCRFCGTCDGACPRGLPVSDIVRYAMYAEGYRDYAMGRSRFDRLPAALHQVRCAECGECVVNCPNGVAVRDRLMRAQELFC